MRKYEIMTIAKKSLGEDGAKSLSSDVQQLISSLDGVVTKTDFWGKRKFAYKIKGDTEGFYDVLNFELDPSKLDTLKSKLNLMTGLVRYLVTQVE